MSIDINVNDRTPPTPCQTEGCTYPRYHACIFGKPDLFPMLLGETPRERRRRQQRWATGPKSEEARAAMRVSQGQRWAQVRLEEADRDEALIKEYAKGAVGMLTLAHEYDLNIKTVRRILHEAAVKGRVTIRKTGGAFNRTKSTNAELEDKIILLYTDSDIGMEPLAAELGISRDVVRRVLLEAQDAGILKIRPRGSRYLGNEERNSKIMALSNKGMPAIRISEELGINYDTVRNVIKRARKKNNNAQLVH